MPTALSLWVNLRISLSPDTTYYYQAGDKEIRKFQTRNSDAYSFIFVGDPQIGSSNSEKAKKPEDIAKDTFKTAQREAVLSDSFNWNHTLNLAVEKAGSKPSRSRQTRRR